MPLRGSKRPSVVDGKVLEPEWDQVPRTYGSFNQDTLARIAKAQAEHADTARPTSERPHSRSSSPRHPPRGASLNWGASIHSTSSQQPANRRYYNDALSDEDRTALAIGDLNHNLREWTGDRLVQYHVSRIELVPYTDKRQEIIAEILDDKRSSEELVLKSARQAKRFVSSPLNKLQIFKEVKTHTKQTYNEAASSTVDLRAASTPSFLLSPTSPASPTSPETPAPRDGFPFSLVEAQSTHKGTSSNGDYFSTQMLSSSMVRSPHTSESSRDSSHNRGRAPDRHPLVRKADRNTSRVRSSLASEALPYVAKADVTFDAFLAPHASGKGETHRDSIYTKQEEQPRNFSRRLSKMPSMPQLKKRASQAFNLR
ncbi:hypothetical protein P171DRAFT_240447 [Karstenula rhodostoma CBS 690.94]|uniref:Uncharacterized protein n=1 Tax=Karstenula rhodostoma CBS 690.94 TaxID=1392251 RepID=A0A9P4PMS0_9PLEO|nr:hypothetical protein P171DRAFT_240447 [Karstenula rhodostoma CBS 690.94]